MAPSASASFGIHTFEAAYDENLPTSAQAETSGPSDLQAGSHPYQFAAKFTFNTKPNTSGEPVADGSVKNIQIKFPRGVIGNLAGIPRCPMEQFAQEGPFISGDNGSKCPIDTQVGVITVNGSEYPLFNLVSPAGIAGQLGAVVLLMPTVINLSIRNESDYGMTAELQNLTQVEEAKEISLALWGVPADPRHNHLRCLEQENRPESCPSGAPIKPLLTMPTSCGEPLTTTVAAESWEEPNTGVEKSVTASGADGLPGEVSGCERLPFNPSVAVQPESSAPDTPTGLSVDVGIPYKEASEGLAEANLKNVVIAFPGGLSINAATAGGLVGCTPDQIGLGKAAAPTCPAASKIGNLEIATPILSKPLNGAIYLAQPTGEFEGVMDIYLAAEASGLQIKLPAQLSAQLGSGQLTFTLDNAPELPLSNLRIDLFGGPRATIANPAVCSAFTTSAELTPYSAPESNVQTRSSNFAIEGCTGGFTPSFTGGGTSAAAGQGTDFGLRVSRSDGQQYLQGLTTILPAGLMANTSSVPRCGDAEAAAGTCPAASEIGTVSVGVGAGPDPYYLNGRVYLTGPYEGASFGLSMVIPAQAGPFDLGTAIVRGTIAVNVATSTLTITTDAFPSILRGIPLRTKELALSINRAGFMVNPTTCAGQTITGTVGSLGGASAAVSSPFRVVGCSGLPFAPKLAATTLAKASSRGNGASFDVKVTNAPGTHANLQSVVIKLPKPLKPRLAAVQQACLAATFAANPAACSTASVVGTAAVDTSALNTPMTGPVYLVFHRGIKYPDLVMVLQGGGLSLQITGLVSVDKGISTTAFNQLPDIPMSLFELNLPEGSHSLLGSSENLCAKRRSVGYTMGGHNGGQSQGAEKVEVEGCAVGTAKASRNHHRKASGAHSSARAKRRRS